MPNLIERINREFDFGLDKPGLFESRDRADVLDNLTCGLPVSEMWTATDFMTTTELRDLIEESDSGDTVTKNKFDKFLRDRGLWHSGYLVKRVIGNLAYPKVFGRDVVMQYHLPTIKDAQELVKSGNIAKIDGFDVAFNVEVARRLFA